MLEERGMQPLVAGQSPIPDRVGPQRQRRFNGAGGGGRCRELRAHPSGDRAEAGRAARA